MYTIEQMKTEALLALKTALGKDYSPTMHDLEKPKDPAHGDLAFPCFRLAQGMKRNPAEIARELAAKIAPKGLIKEVKAMGPYLNIIMDSGKILSDLAKQTKLLGKKYGTITPQKRTVMIEYSGFNTHKPVHIGHVRNVVYGATAVRLMRALGVQVIAADFVNDLGLHVAQWMEEYQKHHLGEKPPKGGTAKWLAQIYVEGVKHYEESEDVKKRVAQILKRFQEKDKATMALWKKSRDLSLKEFKAVHKELGAEFDTFYAESDFVEARMKVVEELVIKGVAKKSQGAIIVDLEDVGLGIFVILRSDGTALYATTDLALALQKFKDYKLDASYYITDARQKQHFSSLFETLKRSGVEKEFRHLPYEFVTLPEGAMSSRKGTVIYYEVFRDALIEAAREETKKRHPDWKPKAIEKTARALAFGAMKFDMLKSDVTNSIVFDPKEALSFDGFSSPYLQYTTARIAGILRKTKKPARSTKRAEVKDERERRLIVELSRYPDVIREAANSMSPAVIAHYLFSIAKLFADFYEHVPVSQAMESDRALHLEMLGVLSLIMKNGLELLGVEAMEEM